MIQAQVFVPPVINKARFIPVNDNLSNNKPWSRPNSLLQPVTPVRVITHPTNNVSVCTVDLAFQLHVVSKGCKHAIKCKFNNVVIKNPCHPNVKQLLITHVEKVANSDDFKSKMVAAINALP